MKNESEPENEIVRREVMAGRQLNEELPPVGTWFWVTYDVRSSMDDEVSITGWKKKRAKTETRLMCVEHIASNHVRFVRYYASKYGSDSGESTVRVSFAELLTHCRPEPNWKEITEKEMALVKAAMDEQTRLLYEAGKKANAITDTTGVFQPQDANPLALSLRTADPAIMKRDLLAVKEQIPLVKGTVDKLAKQYAALAKNLYAGEIAKMEAVVAQLDCVQDKIFTLEIYAGMREEVLQIRKGAPAGPEEKLAVRQSLLFMDEETLIDYASGGMDFEKLADFDKWCAKPENTQRVLPEKRGVVAFRVRREDKDYGPVHNLFEAFMQAEWKKRNLETYLLIRNGEQLYRIASAVDFSPRLIPLATEFDNAFTQVRQGWYNFKTGKNDPDDVKKIGPADFDYDEERKKVEDKLKASNRIVVLLQGLLDRSEVFHPHAPINLASPDEFEEWVNPVRDEEGALEYPALTWEEYRDAQNAKLRPGDWIWTNYKDPYARGYNVNSAPDSILRVDAIRKGRKTDACSGRYNMQRRETEGGREESECVGIPGVEVSWAWGTKWGYDHGTWGVWGEHKVNRRCRLWIPLDSVFNLSAYRSGDYKQFLCDRRQKGRYLKWAPALLKAEDVIQGRRAPKDYDEDNQREELRDWQLHPKTVSVKK